MLREGAAALAPVHDGDEALADRLEAWDRRLTKELEEMTPVLHEPHILGLANDVALAAARLRGGNDE